MEPYHIPEHDQELARLHRTNYLIAAFIDDRLTPAEREELDNWVGSSTENLLFFEEATDEVNIEKFRSWYQKLDMEKARRRILDKLETRKPRKWKLPAPLAFAACVVLLAGLGIGIYYVTQNRQEESPVAKASEGSPTLTLADGRTIELDRIGDGTVEGTGDIMISKEGTKLQVNDLSDSQSPEGLNTLTVPRGKQYNLVLTDGSRVELNAGSSLQFPSAFRDAERKVKLTGEGFFEVAKSKDHPFVVQAQETSITVLGTKFNVNAYENETSLLTTLVEGSVKMSADNQELVLKPGEQGFVENRKIRKAAGIDLQKATAWRTGEFVFRDTPLDEILRTLQRWYDVEVDNQAKRNERFSGTFSKTLTLEKIMHYLEQTDRIHFNLKEKRLTVSN